MINEVFSDYFACKDNFLTRIDARIKMLFVFAAIITTLFSQTPQTPLTAAILSLVSLISIRIPLKVILLRLLTPLNLTTVVFLLYITVYKESFWTGMLAIEKVIGCVSLIIFLSMTTPVNALLNASLWFNMPKIWVEIAVITYRYVFVLFEDAITIRDAQKVRLGYSNLSRGIRSFGELTGSIFIRAYDQSLATYEAMQLRGYSGTAKTFTEQRFKKIDMLPLIIFSIILFLLVVLNH